MKKILLSCFLATAAVTCVNYAAHAQATSAVSSGTFTAKVNRLDSLIGAGSSTLAAAAWDEIHDMMLAELAATKAEIAGASSGDVATYTATLNTQVSLYRDIWGLKSSLTTNRAALHSKLLTFAATI